MKPQPTNTSRRPCPVCREIRPLPCALDMQVGGGRVQAQVCPICFEATQASHAYSAAAGHALAQRQHHERTRHAR